MSNLNNIVRFISSCSCEKQVRLALPAVLVAAGNEKQEMSNSEQKYVIKRA